jgi:GNAT superfamily N-acetyltransferase
MTPLTLTPGYHAVPHGNVAFVVTHLEMHEKPRPKPAPLGPRAFELVRVPNPDIDEARALFRRIGENWLWFSRLRKPEDELAKTFSDPAYEVYHARQRSGVIGLVELDLRVEGEVEIAFFGLVPEATGSGAGKWLMNQALAKAWRPGVNRVWLHTCTGDHPAALPFYIRAGFTPFKRAIEIAPDPRLDGTLPRAAGQHVPLIEGEPPA